MTRTPWRRTLLGLCLVVGLLTAPALASPPMPEGQAAPMEVVRPAWPVTCLDDLRRLDACQLEQLFAGAEAGAMPVGYVRGEILYLTNPVLPGTRKWLAGGIWKGKDFEEGGHLVNQWAGIRAVGAQAEYGPSRFDGRPAIIIEYPPNSLVFKHVRDEIRQVAPGVYLARLCDRAAPYRLRGVIGLELQPDRGQRCR